jgi:hypothetical protein
MARKSCCYPVTDGEFGDPLSCPREGNDLLEITIRSRKLPTFANGGSTKLEVFWADFENNFHLSETGIIAST